MEVRGVRRTFLLDSGCDLTIVPANFVDKGDIYPSDKVVRAANDAEIPLLGEARLELHLGRLNISTTALVSEHIIEGMLGYDWLSGNDCFWGFGNKKIIIQDVSFPLHAGNKTHRCCRIVAQEKVVIPGKSEVVVDGKAVFEGIGRNLKTGLEFVTKVEGNHEGLLEARTVLPNRCVDVPI